MVLFHHFAAESDFLCMKRDFRTAIIGDHASAIALIFSWAFFERMLRITAD
jgi:hypothetical protein